MVSFHLLTSRGNHARKLVESEFDPDLNQGQTIPVNNHTYLVGPFKREKKALTSTQKAASPI